MQKDVFAHAKDQSYLYLRVYQTEMEGTVETTYKDLNTALGLDLRDEMGLDELRPYLPQIQRYILERVDISSVLGVHNITFVEPRLMPSKLMGTFLKSDFVLDNVDSIPDALEVSYNLIFDQDPAHTAFLVVRHNWKAGIIDNEGLPSATFTRNSTTTTLSLTEVSVMKGVWKMAKLGMRHILIGLDHILFLIALLLPLVMRRKNGNGEASWEPLDSLGTALKYVIQVVIAFSVGYSLTLHLGARGVIPYSARIAESMIALSIGLAALHILKPVFGRREWIIALLFGLFHGLGFASMLGEKGLRGEYLIPSLAGFNFGIEAGQILLVAILFPLFYFFRKSPRYQKVLYYGSILLILIALYWFIERFFEVDFIIDNYIGKAFGKVVSIFHHH